MNFNEVCNDIPQQIGFSSTRPMSVSPAGVLVPKTQKFWTTRELARLRECYSTMPQDELLAAFAPHSLISIRVMAHKLKVRRRRDWAAIASQHVPAFTLS